nr:PREDICTED: NAC domain-containing protein 89-like [Daucus carota subsp. sativus]
MAEKDGAKPVKAFRFDPFDEELITDYLKRKIMGEQLPCNTVKDREIYGPSCSPWRVFDPDDHGSWLKSPHVKASEKFMYVFARLSKISSSKGSKNTSKRAGCGTWVGRTKRDMIKDGEGNLIGEKRYLVFEINEVDCGETGVGFYSMHEYSLSGVNEGLDCADTTVLCRVTYDSAKKTKVSPNSSARVAATVSTSCGEGRDEKEIQSKNLEGASSVTAEILAVSDSVVGDQFAIVQLDDGVQGSNDFGEGLNLDELGSLDFYFNDLEFDSGWISECLDFSQEEEPYLDGAINLGKRNFQWEENSHQAKKMCLDNFY